MLVCGGGVCAIGWAIEEFWKAFHVSQAPERAEEALEFGDVGFEKEAGAAAAAWVLGIACWRWPTPFSIPWLGFTLVHGALPRCSGSCIGGIRKPGQLLA
jgi:hypothetical protein